MNRALALSLAIVLVACPSEPPPDPGPQEVGELLEGDATPITEVVQAPAERAVYAYMLSEAADAPHGAGAYGVPGRVWILGNQVVRFAIQDVGESVGLSLHGGNLIDAQRRLGDGRWSSDLFREIIAFADFRFVIPQTIEVVDDGAEGDQAVLRVSGQLGKTQIVEQLDALSGNAPLDVVLEYELAADSRILTMRTTITNPTEDGEYGAVGDFISFGDSLQLFTPETGFSRPESVNSVSLVATRGEEVSYAYGRAEGQIGVPLTDSSGLGTVLDIAMDFPAGESVSVERWFAVGDGSPASVIHPLLERMERSVAVVTGAVLDASGAPVAATSSEKSVADRPVCRLKPVMPSACCDLNMPVSCVWQPKLAGTGIRRPAAS